MAPRLTALPTHFAAREIRGFSAALALLIGVGIGVGVGLLIAPASGEETLSEINDKVSDRVGKP